MKIEDLIDTDIISIEKNRIYNFIKESPSSKFYDELFSESFNKNKKTELYHQMKKDHVENGQSNKVMEEIVTYLEKELKNDAIVIEIGGGVYQQRSANAYKRFNNYFPLDISYSSIRRYTESFDKIGFVADATKLPFKDNSIDCIFTHTFLEHPIDPEKVLMEISRVLKIGGIVIHNDAWFCRWWQRYGLIGIVGFNNMTLKEKMIQIGATITELKMLRVPPIIMKRLYKEIFQSKDRAIRLSYKKLKPNYDLHLGCDEDAASSIDPIDVVRFYESKNYTFFHQLSFMQRLLFPNKYIVLKKLGEPNC